MSRTHSLTPRSRPVHVSLTPPSHPGRVPVMSRSRPGRVLGASWSHPGHVSLTPWSRTGLVPVTSASRHAHVPVRAPASSHAFSNATVPTISWISAPVAAADVGSSGVVSTSLRSEFVIQCHFGGPVSSFAVIVRAKCQDDETRIRFEPCCLGQIGDELSDSFHVQTKRASGD